MTNSKKLISAMFALGVIGVPTFFTTTVNAQTQTNQVLTFQENLPENVLLRKRDGDGCRIVTRRVGGKKFTYRVCKTVESIPSNSTTPEPVVESSDTLQSN